ncbi:hypothetical protein NPN18_25760, partial [Vibrio parahaemolyticus]|nr:hypothetical protein [Vibrio parahaemolyticus]
GKTLGRPLIFAQALAADGLRANSGKLAVAPSLGRRCPAARDAPLRHGRFVLCLRMPPQLDGQSPPSPGPSAVPRQ